jgi:hypothetical protein
MARINELLVGFGKTKQADIATANTLAEIWRLNKLNTDLASPKLNAEDDASEIGKGHEFATATYPSHWDVGPFKIEKYLSSQFAAWVMAFCLGDVTATGTAAPYTYTCKPLDPSTAASELELPYFSYIEQLRPGANKIIDRLMSGCVINSFELALISGPGRSNATLTAEIIGSGKVIEPSAIVLPSLTPEVALPGSSMTLVVNGHDYVADKTILNVTAGFTNNVDANAGFFPGSGFQTTADATSGAIRGRLEIGTRAPSLKFSARLNKNSSEYASLKAQTTGAVTLGVSNGADNSLLLTYPKVAFKTVDEADSSNIVTVNVDCAIEYDDTTKTPFTAVVKTGVNGICVTAA